MSRCSENAEKICKSYPNCDGCNAYGNKMPTDAEIVKALEVCANKEMSCKDDCPLYDICEKDTLTMIKAVKDLINRQKAEIKRLEGQVNLWQEEASSDGCENEWLKACLKEKNEEIERLNRDYSTAVETMSESIRKANAEVERFKKIETTVNAFWSELQKITTFKKKSKPTLEELLEYMENLKAEVINELAHRSENRIATNTDISNAQYQSIIFEISEACKEMVGDAE